MRLLAKVSTIILGTAVAAAMAAGQANALTGTSAITAAPARATVIPQAGGIFWFATYFKYSTGTFGEAACIIQGGALKAQWPNDIYGTACAYSGGGTYFILWLKGDSKMYDRYHA
jgi:hypothetical protein